MYAPKGRTVGRTILTTWLATGVMALGYCFTVSGCAPVVTEVAPPVPADAIGSLEQAEQAWRARRIAEYQEIWQQEQGADGDPFSAGLAAYHLASATGDSAWSNSAIEAFDRVLEQQPDLTIARTWRGSAHALMARDYPIQGILQVIPGPGFARLYHVWASFSDLDSAVDTAPNDPVIRLIRGSTYLGMPEIFGGLDTGLTDFRKLHDWTRDPQGHPEYADILRSQTWRERYHLARARAMEHIDRNKDAVQSWMRIVEITEDPVLLELAKWHKSSIAESR